MQKNLSQGHHAQNGAVYGIHDILAEIRQKSLTEKEKGTDFERLMKLWFMTDPRYSNLQKVWQRGGLPHPCFGSRKIKDLLP